jgi:hypothetical protein
MFEGQRGGYHFHCWHRRFLSLPGPIRLGATAFEAVPLLLEYLLGFIIFVLSTVYYLTHFGGPSAFKCAVTFNGWFQILIFSNRSKFY